MTNDSGAKFIGRGLSSPYAPLPPRTLWAFVAGLVFHLYTIFVEPLLCHLQLRSPGGSDPTYGRSNIPPNMWENKLVYSNPDVEYRTGKVWLRKDALEQGGTWDRPGSAAFISYTVFWIPEAVKQSGIKADVALMHGINDYQGKMVPHGHHFARAGFRVILIDLPCFGRSSGLHAYLPSMRLLIEAVYAVLQDVKAWDRSSAGGGNGAGAGASAARRKLFLEGNSMGGFTALYYAAVYGSPGRQVQPNGLNGLSSTTTFSALPSSDPPATLHKRRQPQDASSSSPGPVEDAQVDGVVVAAPMIGISPESRPPYVVEVIARVLRFFCGRLPLASGVRGNVSDDHRVEDEFHLDPMTYKGKLRIATGLAILEGLNDLHSRAGDITCPVSIHHGSHDRATSYKGSEGFFNDELKGIDRSRSEFKVWQGYEHVMMKNVHGQNEEDDRKRDAVLNEITKWLVHRAKE